MERINKLWICFFVWNLCHIECIVLMSRVEEYNIIKVQNTRGFRNLGQFRKIVPAPGFFLMYCSETYLLLFGWNN